ncbi:2-phospho-L-lactate guanylyltransferase [Myxococcota bacterium]|nr:2-phospho-L-lactate guanylyltransferase [Myxococcota bacterium]MCZ7620021.1 2-phospho-L-lactate guanylyltransferase [Myxococcota bacterium]
MTAAVVPMKSLASAKSRLAAALGRSDAEALSLAMLEDVVAALRALPTLDAVGVVTPDETVARSAERAGALALRGDDPGLNEALQRAARELGAACDGGLLVVLGDVAGVRTAELAQVLRALSETPPPCAVMVPSRDGGTAALARNPHDVFPAQFGPDSARVHRAAAAQAGVPLIELALASLAIDIDDKQDLRDFAAGPGAGPRTRARLAALGLAPAASTPRRGGTE